MNYLSAPYQSHPSTVLAMCHQTSNVNMEKNAVAVSALILWSSFVTRDSGVPLLQIFVLFPVVRQVSVLVFGDKINMT